MRTGAYRADRLEATLLDAELRDILVRKAAVALDTARVRMPRRCARAYRRSRRVPSQPGTGSTWRRTLSLLYDLLVYRLCTFSNQVRYWP